jgi:hypothetical protein
MKDKLLSTRGPSWCHLDFQQMWTHLSGKLQVVPFPPHWGRTPPTPMPQVTGQLGSPLAGGARAGSPFLLHLWPVTGELDFCCPIICLSNYSMIPVLLMTAQRGSRLCLLLLPAHEEGIRIVSLLQLGKLRHRQVAGHSVYTHIRIKILAVWFPALPSWHRVPSLHYGVGSGGLLSLLRQGP